MSSDNFTKVFDVLDSGFKNWWFPVFGLIFVVVGLVIFFEPKVVSKTGISHLNFQSKWQTFFRYFFLGFAILWTSIAFYSTCSSHRRRKTLVEEGACLIVEGPVENFVPMPYAGHADESFSVSGIQFRYSDYEVADGFNNTSSHGGPISKDSFVRICYDPSDNQILRLEVRDFKGQQKDHSQTENPFSRPRDFPEVNGKNSVSRLPWYSNLFIILYFLDFLALLNLFVPYVKTYYCLKTSTVNDCAVPLSFDRGKKVKLRNSILFWDNKTQGIWLRPRGFNLFQIQLMVAKLNVDELGKSIISQEIRFSSGFPFILALFLSTAYQFFTVAIPAYAEEPSSAQFLGIAAVMFVIFGFLNLKRLCSRMETLVQDALSEIKEI